MRIICTHATLIFFTWSLTILNLWRQKIGRNKLVVWSTSLPAKKTLARKIVNKGDDDGDTT